MFYNQNLLSKEGPLATVWLAANLEKKLSKSQLLHTNISKTAKAIINSDNPENIETSATVSQADTTTGETSRLVASQPIALRLSGQLLYGVVKIYSRKERYLLDDVSNVLVRLKTIFKSNNLQSVILPANKTIANVNRLILPDTITEANILPQLFQQEPLDLGLDLGTAPGAAPAEGIMDSSQRMAREAGEHTDFQLSIDLDRSVEAGRNVLRQAEEQSRTADDHSFIRRAIHGEDDLNEADDLVLDFGNDEDFIVDEEDEQQVPFASPQQFGPSSPGPEGPSIPLDFGDQTIEQGRRLSVTEQDITFGTSQLFKEGEEGAEAGPTTSTPPPTREPEPEAHHEIFGEAPLEVIAEQEEGQQQQQQQRIEEQARQDAARKRSRRAGTRRETRKRLVVDENIEIPTTEFQSTTADVSTAAEVSREARGQQIRKRLNDARRLFYLKKYSNPGNTFANAEQLRDIWNTKDIEPGPAAKRRRIEEEEPPERFEDLAIQAPEPDVTAAALAEREADQGMSFEIGEGGYGPHEFDLGMDFGDQFEPMPHEAMEGETTKTGKESSNDKSETFLQKLSTNEFASSLVGSSQYQAGDEEEMERASAVSEGELRRRDIETSSQVESQYGETSSKSISKSTLKIASVLRNEFIDNQEKTINLETVIDKDMHGETFEDVPLSNSYKKETVRCFFELLVLATGDAITLKQDRLFGEISVGCKNNLFERF